MEQALTPSYSVYTMPKTPARRPRRARQLKEPKPARQPHVVSVRLSPFEFEQLESHVANIGTNRSDFIRHAVTSAVMGQLSFTDLMPMAVTGIERDVFELRRELAQQSEVIKCLAAASIGTAALLLRKEDSTHADNQRRVDNAVDLAFKNAPLIIEHCLRWNPALKEQSPDNRSAGDRA